MPIQVLLAAAAVACAAPLLWWALSSRRTVSRSVAANLHRGAPVADLRELVLAQSATDRAVLPALQTVADRIRRITPASWIDALDHRLTIAGRPQGWTLERALAAKVVLGLGGALVGRMLYAPRGTMLWAVIWVGITALGYFAPDLLLYSRGQERQQQIRNELSDTLDQMTISVEAGLGFEAAMQRAGRTGTGPLADELMRTLQEVQVGVDRSRALRNLADRTTVSELRQFVIAVVQAENYGVPIANVLRTQAAEMRLKRRQRAEERAMKIPVKIVFPLVVCILPSLFIVILGPAVIRISRTLLGG